METSVNNKCKSFTSLEQSKKLTEILPIESADMYYDVDSYGVQTTPEVLITSVVRKKDVPCWSLAALLGVLPSSTLDSSNDPYYMLHCMERISGWHENPIDACYEMIVGLHGLNLL